MFVAGSGFLNFIGAQDPRPLSTPFSSLPPSAQKSDAGMCYMCRDVCADCPEGGLYERPAVWGRSARRSPSKSLSALRAVWSASCTRPVPVRSEAKGARDVRDTAEVESKGAAGRLQAVVPLWMHFERSAQTSKGPSEGARCWSNEKRAGATASEGERTQTPRQPATETKRPDYTKSTFCTPEGACNREAIIQNAVFVLIRPERERRPTPPPHKTNRTSEPPRSRTPPKDARNREGPAEGTGARASRGQTPPLVNGEAVRRRRRRRLS